MDKPSDNFIYKPSVFNFVIILKSVKVLFLAMVAFNYL